MPSVRRDAGTTSAAIVNSTVKSIAMATPCVSRIAMSHGPTAVMVRYATVVARWSRLPTTSTIRRPRWSTARPTAGRHATIAGWAVARSCGAASIGLNGIRFKCTLRPSVHAISCSRSSAVSLIPSSIRYSSMIGRDCSRLSATMAARSWGRIGLGQGDDALADILADAVQAQREPHVREALGESQHAIHHADRGHQDLGWREVEEGGVDERRDGFVHVRFIVEGLAHAHENHVAQAPVLGGPAFVAHRIPRLGPGALCAARSELAPGARLRSAMSAMSARRWSKSSGRGHEEPDADDRGRVLLVGGKRCGAQSSLEHRRRKNREKRDRFGRRLH